MKTNILKSKTLWSYALGYASETLFPKLSTSSIEWKTSAESSPHATLKYTTSTFLVRNRWTKSCTRYSIQTRLSPTRRIEPSRAHTQFHWKPVPYSRNKSYPALWVVNLKIDYIRQRAQDQSVALNLTKSYCSRLIRLTSKLEEDYTRIRIGQVANLLASNEASH